MDLDDLQRLIAARNTSLWLYTATGSGEGVLLWLVGDAPAVQVTIGPLVQVLTPKRLRSATGREVSPAEAAALVATWRKTCKPDRITVNGWHRAGRVSV